MTTASETTRLAHDNSVQDDDAQADQAMEVIEIEMTEFAYEPETIDIQGGAPAILRFTNAGKLGSTHRRCAASWHASAPTGTNHLRESSSVVV